jgi:hypothetical protein
VARFCKEGKQSLGLFKEISKNPTTYLIDSSYNPFENVEYNLLYNIAKIFFLDDAKHKNSGHSDVV